MKKYKNLLTIILLLIICTPLMVSAFKVHNITLDKKGGSGGTDKTVASGDSDDKLFLQEVITVPTLNNKAFEGYYSSNGKTQYYDSDGNRTYDKPVPTSLKTIYAKWGSGQTKTIYFVKNTDACNKAKNNKKCERADGCYDTITDQTKGEVMNKSKVNIPDFGGTETFFGYTEKSNGTSPFYDLNGNLIGRRKWNQGVSTGCLYAKNTLETVSEGSNGSDSFTGGFGLLVELIKYDNKTGTESSIGKPYLYAAGSLLADFEEPGPSDGSSTTSGGGGGTLACIQNTPGCNSSPPWVQKLTIGELRWIDLEGLISDDKWTGEGKYLKLDGTMLTRLANGSLSAAPTSCKQFVKQYNFSSTYHYNRGDIKYVVDASGGERDESNIHVNVDNSIANANLYDYSKVLSSTSFGDVNSIASKFGLNESQKSDLTLNLDRYYLSFEPVVREKTGSSVGEESNSSFSTSTSGAETWNWTCHADCYGTTVASAGEPSGECYQKHECEKWDSCKYHNACTHCHDCKDAKPGDNCEEGCDHDYDCGGGWVNDGSACTCNERIKKHGSKQSWDRGSCASYLVTTTTVSTHTDIYYKTIIKPARYHGNAQVIKSLSSTIYQEEAKHVNEETWETEYYIGPELESALTGQCGPYPDTLPNNYVAQCKSRSNKYSLYNRNFTDFKYTVQQAKTAAIGVLYLWVPTITSCRNECPTSRYSGDGLLSCAENYCDSLFYYEDGKGFQSQKLKASCIADSCQYKKVQNNCDDELNNESTLNSIISGSGVIAGNNKPNTKYNSTCNVDNKNQLSDNNYGYKAYCPLSSKTPTKEKDVNLDVLHFVNVLCVEGTSCGFNDVSTEKLTRGRRIDYYQKVHLTKKCKVWFDVDSWKFYYASIPSNETVYYDANNNGKYEESEITTSRNRMIQIIKDYNESAKRGYSGSISNTIAEASELVWEDLNYDTTGLSLTLEVTEKQMVNGTEKTKTPKPFYVLSPVTKDDVNSEGDKEVINQEEINIADTTEFNSRKAYSFERLARIPRSGDLIPKEFSTSSSYDATYEIPDMYCISLDKEATPYKWTNENELCPDKTLPAHAYYLSLTTKGATFKSTCSNSDYMESEDTCVMNDGAANFSCDIHINDKNGKNCCQYNGPVDVQLIVHSEPSTNMKVRGIGLYALKPGESAPANDINGYEAINNYNPKGTVTIVGTVQYGPEDPAKQTKVHCYKTISVDECIKDGCQIKLDNNYKDAVKTRYTVKDAPAFVGRWTKYYAKTSSRSSYYQLLGRENGEYTFYATQKEPLANVKNTEENKAFDIIGKVTNNNSCGICCRDLQYKTEYDKECTTDLKDLKEYCSMNYQRDKHCFTTYDDCITYYYSSCACPAFSTASNLDSLKTWCKQNYDGLYASETSCIQNCCQDQVKCAVEDEIIYRPVDNTCPFPNSYEQKGVCEQGDRLIGKNWIGQVETITDEGDQVYDRRYNEEYVIDLNQETIKNIQSKYAYDNTGMSRYYSYVDGGNQYHTCHDAKYNGYCSDFIHGSGYFSKIRGIKNGTFSYQEKQKN